MKKKKENYRKSTSDPTHCNRSIERENVPLQRTSSTIAASPPLVAAGAAPLVLAATSPPAPGSKYSLISASSSSTLFGLGRPGRAARLPRPFPAPAASLAPVAGFGVAADLGWGLALALPASFLGCEIRSPSDFGATGAGANWAPRITSIFTH